MSKKSRATRSKSKRSRRIIRMAHLRTRYPFSESHIYSLIKQGKFPKPFPLVPVTVYAVVVVGEITACTPEPIPVQL